MNKTISPIDVLCRELRRLDNDSDRLQMLVTLKSHLGTLSLNDETLRLFFSIFNDEQYRLRAIDCLLISINKFLTPDSVTVLLQLFTTSNYRLYLLEMLKNSEQLKTNSAVHETVLHEYRQYFHVEAPVITVKKAKSKENVSTFVSVEEPTIDASCSSKNDICLGPISDQIPQLNPDVGKVSASTSGVFEKAKQFVCRVFGGGSSSQNIASPSPMAVHDEQKISRKRLATASSLPDNDELKKSRAAGDPLEFEPQITIRSSKAMVMDDNGDDLHHSIIVNDDQSICLSNTLFQPTSCPLNTSRSYTSITTKSPPPSPVTTPQPIASLTENILSQLDATIRKHVNEKINNEYAAEIRKPILDPIIHRLQAESPEQPIVHRQTSMSFHVPELVHEDSSPSLIEVSPSSLQPFMLTRIHSVLDNIDSVLDKMEAQTNSAIRRPAFNENYHSQQQESTPIIAPIESRPETSALSLTVVTATEEFSNVPVQHGTDQITQTPSIPLDLAQAALSIVAHRLGPSGGSGDSTPALINMLDIEEESRSTSTSESDDDDLEIEDANWLAEALLLENDISSHPIFDDDPNNDNDDSL